MEYMLEEAEDPPEPVKTAAYLLNEWDPLHKLEEKLDTKHMIAHGNWGILFTSEEYWSYTKPFEEEIFEENAFEVEYEGDIEDLSYEIKMNTPISLYLLDLKQIFDGNYLGFEELNLQMEVKRNDEAEEELHLQPLQDADAPGEELDNNELKIEKEDFLIKMYQVIEKSKRNTVGQQDVNKILHKPKSNITEIVQELIKEGLMKKRLSLKLKLTNKGIHRARK